MPKSAVGVGTISQAFKTGTQLRVPWHLDVSIGTVVFEAHAVVLKVGAIGRLPRTLNVVTKATLWIVAVFVKTGGCVAIRTQAHQFGRGGFVGVIGQVVFLTRGFCCS